MLSEAVTFYDVLVFTILYKQFLQYLYSFIMLLYLVKIYKFMFSTPLRVFSWFDYNDQVLRERALKQFLIRNISGRKRCQNVKNKLSQWEYLNLIIFETYGTD